LKNLLSTIHIFAEIKYGRIKKIAKRIARTEKSSE